MAIHKEYVRDFYGRILGSVETDEKGNKTVRDFYGRILGKYDKSTNTTRDFYGRVLTNGDSATGLIYAEADKQKK